MKTVFVAGATGYLGRNVVAEYLSRGWTVRALVRDRKKAADLEDMGAVLVEAEATFPSTLCGTMAGVDLVISTLGITRQRDGLSYRDVDFGANAALLDEAIAAGVDRFAYVHVLNADKMAHVPLVAAKQAFVDRLLAAPIRSTIIAPTGFYSDMGDFLAMARRGRVWLFGSGDLRLNPIDGADLATAIAGAVEAGRGYAEIGGPELLTHAEVAALAFAPLGRPARITRLPDGLRRLALRILPWIAPLYLRGPAEFFLTALGMDMVGERHGTRRLAAHFEDIVEATATGRLSAPRSPAPARVHAARETS